MDGLIPCSPEKPSHSSPHHCVPGIESNGPKPHDPLNPRSGMVYSPTNSRSSREDQAGFAARTWNKTASQW